VPERLNRRWCAACACVGCGGNWNPEVRARTIAFFLSYSLVRKTPITPGLASATLECQGRCTDVEEILPCHAPGQKSGLRRTTGAHCFKWPDKHPVLSLGDGFNYREESQDKNHAAISGAYRRLKFRGRARERYIPRGAGRVAFQSLYSNRPIRNFKRLILSTPKRNSVFWLNEHGPVVRDEINL